MSTPAVTQEHGNSCCAPVAPVTLSVTTHAAVTAHLCSVTLLPAVLAKLSPAGERHQPSVAM